MPVEFQELDFTIAQGVALQSLNCAQLLTRAFMAVTNPGSFWLHWLDMQGTAFEWTPPNVFMWIVPIPPNVPANIRVSSNDLPTGYTLDQSNLNALASISVLSDYPRISVGLQQLLTQGQKSALKATTVRTNIAGNGTAAIVAGVTGQVITIQHWSVILDIAVDTSLTLRDDTNQAAIDYIYTKATAGPFERPKYGLALPPGHGVEVLNGANAAELNGCLLYSQK